MKKFKNLQEKRTYQCWLDMKQRCKNPNIKKYYLYGGRGVYYCDEWESFSNFVNDMGLKPEKMTLDRINCDGNYEPGNCRWATYKEQGNNTRVNTFLTFEGKTQTLTQWADELSLKPQTVRTRIFDKGWSIERALTTPVSKKRKRDSKGRFI